MEDALRAIGQTMASLGAPDCRLIAPKTLDYRLSQQLASWRRSDPAPQRVTPASLRLLDYAHELAVLTPSPLQHAVVDMAYIAFFYLNRPGKYAKPTSSDSLSAPFRLCDVEFSIGLRVFNASRASVSDIRLATFASLIFTNQKNAVWGGESWPRPYGPFFLLPCACSHPSRFKPPSAQCPPYGSALSLFSFFFRHPRVCHLCSHHRYAPP